jgi:hypothetical protein
VSWPAAALTCGTCNAVSSRAAAPYSTCAGPAAEQLRCCVAVRTLGYEEGDTIQVSWDGEPPACILVVENDAAASVGGVVHPGCCPAAVDRAWWSALLLTESQVAHVVCRSWWAGSLPCGATCWSWACTAG